MWKHFILCFILIGSSYQITQAEVDVNSKQHVDMVWSYLQLRPEDIYTTENDTTSIRNIAALYYGDASYTPLILNANPSLEYDENFIIPTCSIEVTLPSVIKCTEFLPLDCIEKSHLLSGNPLNIAVVPKPIASAAPLEGRTLQQAGEVDYSAFEDIPQPLMEQVHDISPLNLKVDIVNRMEVPLWPRDGGRSSFLKAGSETSYTKKVSPYDVTSYTFSFVSIFQRTFFVEVSIASAPMPQFPFFHPGEGTYIKFVVTNATSGNIKTYYTSPEINPTQGRVSLLTAQGLDQPSLNITLSVDAQWGKNTARVVLESYIRGYYNTYSNLIVQIVPVNNQDVRISLVTQNSDNYHTSLASQAASNFAGQAWRFIHVKESQYRILNLWTGQVLANNPAGLTLHMEDPSAESSRQIWTVLIPWSDSNPGLKRVIQGKGNVCLLLNTRETIIPLLGGIRLRLAPCNMTNSNQMFTIPTILDSEWNHTE